MHARITTPLVLLALTGLPAAASAQNAYQVLPGIIRDFRNDHADFGHASGMYGDRAVAVVNERITGREIPSFSDIGRTLLTEARDASGRPIPAHLASEAGQWTTPESVARPAFNRERYEVSLLDVSYNSDGTSSWTYRVREVAGKDLSHWLLRVPDTVQVMPGTTAGYQFGVDGSTGNFGIKWDMPNDAWTEGVFTIVLDQHYEGAVTHDAAVCKAGPRWGGDAIFAPTANLRPSDGCWDGPDVFANLGDHDRGSITSYDSYVQWFTHVPGVNAAMPWGMRFEHVGDGIYEFNAADFHPIDGELYGNQGDPHNRYFTFAGEISFTYNECDGQFVAIRTDGDAWLYINDRLTIDLAGLEPGKAQMLEIDRLELNDGDECVLRLFYAQRTEEGAELVVRTNLEFRAAGRLGSASSALHD
ncbi:MAG TPA: fibro-slime domain-containing protein [Phycisphaerales bacterium]|nr:fibro-slime domain-containing protein [Phycisphaerales bacterium]